jgi:hypothetical protein
MEEVLEECSEKIGENDPDEEDFLRGIWRRATIGGSSRRRSRAGWT